jgi:hypothetical protein
MLDLDLLGNRQRAPDGAGIHQDPVVHEKGGRALSEPFTAKRA